MADGGVSLSLDDYIKVKRKQGDFKTGRKGTKVRPQQQRRGGGRAIQQRGQRKPANQARQQQQKNQKVRKVVGGSRYFNTASPKRKGQNPRIRNQRRGIQTQAAVAGFGKNRVQARQVSGGRNAFQGRLTTRGTSQNLSRGNRRVRGNNRIVQHAPLMSRRNGSQLQVTNRMRGFNNIPRQNNKRVMKLVKKRVQRAHRQLARPRVGLSVGRVGLRSVGMPLRSLLDIQSGVRRSRNGFITVRSPAEKQLQRLVIQEKITRARLARNGNQNGIRNQSRNRGAAVSRDTIRHVQVPIEHRRERYQRNYSHPVPQQSQQVRGYNPYEPSTMYADHAEYGSPLQVRSEMTSRARWSPPIVRTTTNNQYRAVKTEEDYDQMSPGSSLNPEIQRKISFIQNRARSIDSPGIIPDFRGPVASSTVKLGDRFRMYMH